VLTLATLLPGGTHCEDADAELEHDDCERNPAQVDIARRALRLRRHGVGSDGGRGTGYTD
jgi:hypothetical protein